MNIMILFRSREKSNSICSATKHELLKNNVNKYIGLDFVNLDKRNFSKYILASENKPSKIYIWHDEEVTMEWIKTNYPEIIIQTYSEAEKEKREGWLGYEYKYKLAEQIISEVKATTDIVEYYEVNVLWGEIKKNKTTEFDYYRLPSNGHYFLSKEEATGWLKTEMRVNIEKSKKCIENEKAKIEKYEKILKSVG